jgi:hypothetical protein
MSEAGTLSISLSTSPVRVRPQLVDLGTGTRKVGALLLNREIVSLIAVLGVQEFRCRFVDVRLSAHSPQDVDQVLDFNPIDVDDREYITYFHFAFPACMKLNKTLRASKKDLCQGQLHG